MEKPTALFENLREIAPYVEIEAHCTKLGEANFSSILSSAQVICEAFDVPEDKSKLANFVLENLRDKVLISSSGMAGIDSANKIKTRKIAENFLHLWRRRKRCRYSRNFVCAEGYVVCSSPKPSGIAGDCRSGQFRLKSDNLQKLMQR